MLEKWIEAKLAKGDQRAVRFGEFMFQEFGDEPLPPVAVPASNATVTEKPTLKTSEAAVEAKTPQTFSRDQLILPEAQLPQEVSDILKRAEKARIRVFEAYHLSGVTLTKDSKVEGWDKKPGDWYWEEIKSGKISQDAPKLPDAWVLIDKTQKPDYKGGDQKYENDPFGPLLKQLRKDKKIQAMRYIPDTSRFGISHDELTQVVLPEIARILGVETSVVRLPREIEFNVIGNLQHQEWEKTNTWEWFADKLERGRHLFGGRSDFGGLARVSDGWSDDHYDDMGFRPLVVVSPKA